METQSSFLGLKFGGAGWLACWLACMLGWQFLVLIIKVITCTIFYTFRIGPIRGGHDRRARVAHKAHARATSPGTEEKRDLHILCRLRKSAK